MLEQSIGKDKCAALNRHRNICVIEQHIDR